MHPSKTPTAHWISMDGPCKAALARPTSRERQFDWAGGSCSWQCAVEPRQGASSGLPVRWMGGCLQAGEAW